MLQVEYDHWTWLVINKPFKSYVRELFEKHLDENLEAYVKGTFLLQKGEF